MILDRLTTLLVRDRLAHNPAVALIGPRQAGKTTLARQFPGAYFDLEQSEDRVRLDALWGASIVNAPGLVILDEAQAWPEVFPRLRGAIDAQRERNGRFLLLGSVSPALMREVGESLAGRLALVELTPLLLTEVWSAGITADQLWLAGGYPGGGILMPHHFPHWQRDYLALLAQRDLPTWGLPAKPGLTERYFHMLAALHGQVWNASHMARSLGLSHPTINSYLDYLEGAFLVRRLRPFHANIGKRLIKSPKIYWKDTGLLHALLGISDLDQLLRQPWVGASWEGFVIEQVLGLLAASGRDVQPFFFRTYDGQELDFLLDLGHERWAIEVKLTSAPRLEEVRVLNRRGEELGATRRFLVTRSTDTIDSGHTVTCNVDWLLRYIPSITRTR